MINAKHLENKKNTKEKQITLNSATRKENHYYLISLEYYFLVILFLSKKWEVEICYLHICLA